MHAVEKDLIARAKESARSRVRYREKAEKRKIQKDAIIRQKFLEQHPNWQTKKYSLFPRYRKVIELSYGLDDTNGNKVLSLPAIAAIVGPDSINSSISSERVRQIKNKALKLLAED